MASEEEIIIDGQRSRLATVKASTPIADPFVRAAVLTELGKIDTALTAAENALGAS